MKSIHIINRYTKKKIPEIYDKLHAGIVALNILDKIGI